MQCNLFQLYHPTKSILCKTIQEMIVHIKRLFLLRKRDCREPYSKFLRTKQNTNQRKWGTFSTMFVKCKPYNWMQHQIYFIHASTKWNGSILIHSYMFQIDINYHIFQLFKLQNKRVCVLFIIHNKKGRRCIIVLPIKSVPIFCSAVLSCFVSNLYTFLCLFTSFQFIV